MNKQEIYNKVRDHLLSQRLKSFNEVNDCAYRGENGLKCAVGCLIQDEFYSKEFEGVTPSPEDSYRGIFARERLLLRRALSQSGIPVNELTLIFLRKLQIIHDETSPSDWEKELVKLAQNEGLIP